MNLIEQSQLQLPHRCATCGGYSNRKFLDLELSFEDYGCIYICDQCFLFAAKLYEVVPLDSYSSVVRNLETLEFILDTYKRENQELRNAVDAFRNYNPSFDSLTPTQPEPEVPEEGTESPVVPEPDDGGDSEQPDPATPEREVRSPEPTNVGGPKDIYDSLSAIGLKI